MDEKQFSKAYKRLQTYRAEAFQVFESAFFQEHLEDTGLRIALWDVLSPPDVKPHHRRLLREAINDAIEQAEPDTVAIFLIDVLTRLCEPDGSQVDEW